MNFLVGKSGCFFIRQAFQETHGNLVGQLFDGLAQGIVINRVPLQRGTAGKQYHIGLDAFQEAEPIVWCLFELYESAQFGLLVLVAGSFSTPRGAVYLDLSIGKDADGRIVIVQQFGPFDVLQPQTAVGAFPGAAGA